MGSTEVLQKFFSLAPAARTRVMRRRVMTPRMALPIFLAEMFGEESF